MIKSNLNVMEEKTMVDRMKSLYMVYESSNGTRHITKDDDMTVCGLKIRHPQWSAKQEVFGREFVGCDSCVEWVTA